MDRQRAEAMHGYFLAAKQVEATVLDYISTNPDRRRKAHDALDEEHAATEDCLREGVSLPELDALAAIAGSRFAPAWAVRAYGGGR